MATNSQNLPPREASLFKKILKHFKDKQFKNGLKVANQILQNPKFSEHGETLSMKGLILNSMGKKQEAFDYVRRGLKNDVRSHVCWHVFGLLQKADHKYEEAIKCYRNALRLKKDSVQILSDLSLVQIQTRDLEGYRDSRYQLFSLRPGERSTWIGCAMAYHLTGDTATAVNLLSEYQKTNASAGMRRNNRRNNETYEHSELLLYNISILMECSRYDEALSLLLESENEIVDKVSYYQYMTEIYLSLERFKDAHKIIMDQLIIRNPENVYYYELLEKANHIADEEQRMEMFNELACKYPRSQTITRLPLNFITNLEIFTTKMDSYLRKGFRKGQPAMFRDLKHLYNGELEKCSLGRTSTYSKLELKLVSPTIDRVELESLIAKARHVSKLPPKIGIIENLLLNYVDNLKSNNSFDSKPSSNNEEAVTCLLWVYYFLAQHFDALKEFSMALYFANCALVHTPTMIDIFVIKAKIFKHAGFPEKAAKYLEEAQSLDTSDRYLNSKCAKYLIRINKIKEAEEMCSKFTREGVSAMENLNEMQCMWFLNEMASAYQRMNMFGEALKKCIEVDNHFAEINEDQFDFNTYCMLKVTLRSYVQMIRLEDQLKSHRFFLKTAKLAIEIYLRLHDKPISSKNEDNDDEGSNMTASELRKMRNKQRKAKLKADKENEIKAKKNNEKRDQEPKSEFAEVVDVNKLEKCETPLDDVMRFLTPFKLFGFRSLETHLLAFEVYYRKEKILLQLQCLKRAFRQCNSDSKYYPTLLRQSVLFLDRLHRTMASSMNESIKFVLRQELPNIKIFGINSCIDGDQFDPLSKLPATDEFMAKYLSSKASSFQIRVEHLKTKWFINETRVNNDTTSCNKQRSASEYTESMIESMVKEMHELTDLTLEHAITFYNIVKSNLFGSVSVRIMDLLRQRLHQLYPYASRFMTESEIQELEDDLVDSDYFTAETEEYNTNCNQMEE
ncbi:hypothetical protein RDWZM_007222 [Blomia tropicalis]|uniref:Uncharacterized protein n=1 Tax=Blomia tropicalis TaxID=40697 RepID=A0A9Q0RPB4_BLOTA|nr:hypothetical protein RDWZM_007222 [Blomia tropicalis]